MRIKFIHTADLHIGKAFVNTSYPNDVAKQRRMEQWETFNNVIKLAKERDVDFLFICGDLFEKDFVSMGEIKRIDEGFNKIPQISIIIIAGNHDPCSKDSLYLNYKWNSNVHIFKDSAINLLEFPIKDTAIYGYSWNGQYITDNVLNEKISPSQYTNKILLLHGDAYNKQSKYLPIDINLISSEKFNYVALGHIHKMDKLTPHVYYSGSPEPLDFGETGEHGIIAGEMNSGEVTLEFIPIAKRKFIVMDLELNPDMCHEDIENIISKIAENEKDLFRINLKGMIDSDIDIQGIINETERLFYHVEWINNTVPDYNLEKIAVENEDNVIGAYIREFYNKDMEDPVVKNALFLGLEVLLKERK